MTLGLGFDDVVSISPWPSGPLQSHCILTFPSVFADIRHDLQHDPVLCYPQKQRDGLESVWKPEQEHGPLKRVHSLEGFGLFVFLLFCH